MSLIDKLAKQSILQNQLQSQLAEMSYRAINGKRQEARNFKEGMLNIGTAYFNTPQDKLTKEMIMDYKQAEEERYFERANVFEPTGLSDPITAYTPIPYSTTGTEADETLLNTELEAKQILMNELALLKKDLKDKDTEVRNKTRETVLKSAEVKDKSDEIAEQQLYLKELNKKLKVTQDGIAALAAAAASAATTGSPSVATPGKLNQAKKKEQDLQDDILTVQTNINTLTLDFSNLQAELIQLEKELKTLEGELNTIVTDKTTKETEIKKQEQVIEQVKDNIEDNKVGRQINLKENKKIVQKYEETFNILNRNRNSVKQDPNESDQDYITRIKSLETLPLDKDIFKDKVALEGSRKLMTYLRNVLRDEVKISEIVKSFGPQEVFIINTNWKAIQEQLKIKFGINNPNTTVTDYITEMVDVVSTLQNKPFGTVLAPVASTTSTTLADAKEPGSATNILHTDGSPSEFKTAIEDNCLYIGNKKRKKGIWVKIGKKPRDFIMFSNTTKDEGNFRAFKHTGSDDYNFKKIMGILGLDKDTDIKTQLFGPPGSTVADMINHLKTVIKLQRETSKYFEDEKMYGWGMKNEEVPKTANFGKNIILLNKLYYKNILSVKDKKMHSVEHLPNVKVSDTLAEIIFDMCRNVQPTQETLDSLKSSERELFDLLLYISGLSKSKSIGTKKDVHIKELKERLKLVESQIRAGNNNPVVKSELKEIIQKLYLYNAISMNNGKAYLKQF